MLRKLFSLLLLLTTHQVMAQQPPPIVFFDEQIMSEKRALEMADLTRQKFWERVPGFDGKTPIEPSSDEERKSIPIARWDLLYIALAASQAGDAKRCGVDTADGFLDSTQRTFYKRYALEKQVQFAIAYSIVIYRHVIERLKSVPCSSERADALRRSIEYVSR